MARVLRAPGMREPKNDPYEGKHGIYTASKTKHASKWIARREAGAPIISTWIDEAGEGMTKSFTDLWLRCIGEASRCRTLVLYVEPCEVLKGALVEVGAALASGAKVIMVGEAPVGSFIHHPNVTKCVDLDEAFAVAMEAERS